MTASPLPVTGTEFPPPPRTLPLDYTADAIEDLKAIRGGLTLRGAGPRTKRRLAAIRAEIRRLRQHPFLFPLGEFSGSELHCSGGYRELYELHPDTGRNETAGVVLVLRVSGPG